MSAEPALFASVNGRLVPESEAQVSVFDRGFLYGDTLYETLRTEGSAPVFFAEHWRRLRRSAELAAYDLDWEEARARAGAQVIRELAAKNRAEPARVRLTLSRGQGDPDQIDGFTPTWVVSARPLRVLPESTYEAGVAAILAGVRRNSRRALDPEIKSGNYLNNLFARREARLAGAVEGVMRNEHGHLAEGASSNLFWVRGGVIETPALSVGILHGVTRAKVLELAADLAPVQEVQVDADRLNDAEEIFLTSTTWEVLAVTRWNGNRVGSGRAGSLALRLRQGLRALYPGEQA